jgi:hypothetical protein
VTYSDEIAAFIQEFTKGQGYVSGEGAAFHFTQPEIEALFQRLKDKRVSILPVEITRKLAVDGETAPIKYDNWLIVGDERSALDAFMRAVSRFIAPTYANFQDNRRAINTFDPSKRLGERANRLFIGYYRLESRTQERRTILEKLKLCFRLLEQADAPVALQLDSQPYRQLSEAFRQALLTRQWDEANRLLEVIDSSNLTTADNIHFLRIDWMAHQEQWQEIWNHPYYRTLAALPMPRAIRSAMLTAFHATCILPHEQAENWDAVLDELRQNRATLGLLLNGRFGDHHAAMLRLFAYLAVCDADPAMFERVQNDTPKDDIATRFILSQLESRLPALVQVDARSAAEKLQAALNVSDYETAWVLTEALTEPIDQIAARAQIAFLSGEITLSREALKQYDPLFTEMRRMLDARHPDVRGWLDTLRRRLGLANAADIRTWDDWFRQAQEGAANDALLSALDALTETAGEDFWSLSGISQLTEHLANIENEQYQRSGVYRQAIMRLVTQCLEDKQFPRQREDIADLYDFLLQFILQDEHTEVNAGLVLRLNEAVLTNHPDQVGGAQKRLLAWFARPIPVLQPAALDALELLAKYGVQPASLYAWFRDWVEGAINNPNPDALELEVWLSFAVWIQAGEDILRNLRERIRQNDSVEDRLARLPKGFQIAIFSFDIAASKRAQDILLARNTGLDVRICGAEVNNKTVEGLASTADISVLVTDKTSHDIFYAVKPLAQERLVYANRRGASTILRSIDNYLRNVG